MSRGISGNRGKVLLGSCTISELTDFSFAFDRGLKLYNAYSGFGWQRSVLGNKKVNGTIKGKYDSSDPIDVVLNTDNLVTLQLFFDRDPIEKLYGSARLGTIQYEVNLDTGDIETWSCAFESDGPWQFS